MHAKITDGVVEQFPYSLRRLALDNPNTSFPKQMKDSTLASFGVYKVDDVAPPEVTKTQVANHTGDIVQVDGRWQREWAIRNKSEEEIAADIEFEARSVREKRDKLIADTDWMALSDNTLTAAWATYRQALRDITDHANFPYLGEDDWPVEPA